MEAGMKIGFRAWQFGSLNYPKLQLSEGFRIFNKENPYTQFMCSAINEMSCIISHSIPTLVVNLGI